MSENIHHLSGNLLVGSSHFFVDTTNNRVGITTADPDAGLHVNSNAYVHTDFRVGSDIAMNVTSGRITAGSFEGNGSLLSGVNSDSGSWVNGSSSNVHLATLTDNVGIGIDNPAHKLDVDGDINISTGSTLKVGGTPAVFSNWTVHTNGSDIYRSSGNVGIGTTIPGYQLDLQNIASAQMRIKSNATSGDGDATLIIDSSQIGESDIDFMHDGVLNWRLRTGDASGTNFQIHDQNDGYVFAIKQDGNVGIGINSPSSKLDVNGTIKAGTHMNGGNPHFAALIVSGGGSGSEQQPVAITNSYAESDTIIFCDRNPWVNYAIAHENSSNDFLMTGGGSTNAISNYNVRDFDGTQQTAYVKHRFDVDNAHLEIGGLLKAGLGNGGDLINFGTRSGQAAVYMVSANSTNDWDNYPAFYSSGEAEMRWHGNPNDLNIRSDGWVYGHGGFAPFTGVHTCNSYFSEDKIGLIVCSNGDYCTDDKRCKAWFNDIKIMNTSPLINLCTKEKDKSVFGVVGKIQNTYKKIEFIRKLDYECLPPDQKELYEPLVTGYKHRKTQQEITIEEYDALENKKYFKPIFEQAKAINYDGSTKFQVTHVNSLGEGGIWVTNKSGNFENGDYITSSSVPGYGQRQDDDLLHNYSVAKITTNCGFTKITYTRRHIEQIEGIHQYDENNEPIYINEIDEDGNVIQDLKFKLRYLLPDGTQISEEEYTTRASMDEKVYIAAFVGCTYHCG
jgi:hypothetical protein